MRASENCTTPVFEFEHKLKLSGLELDRQSISEARQAGITSKLQLGGCALYVLPSRFEFPFATSSSPDQISIVLKPKTVSAGFRMPA